MKIREDIKRSFSAGKNNISIDKTLFDTLAIPESFWDFLNRLRKYVRDLDCQNTKDCLENILSIFLHMEISSYSNILQKIGSFDKGDKNILEVIKSKEIANFEWEVVSISFDGIWSTSLDSKSLKEFMKQFIYTINIFENLYKNEWLQMFSINWDEIHIWFFSDKLTQREKIEVFQILSMVLYLITWKEFHHVMLSWRKDKWEDITAIFQENIANTVVSEYYSKKYKKYKKSNLPNYIQIDLLDQKLSEVQLFEGLNIKPYLKINFDKLEENINYLKKHDIPLYRLISKIIINYISNNLQGDNSDLLKNKDIEVVNFPKWYKIISYWEKNNDLYLVLSWDVEIQIFWNPNLVRYSSWKTILWEMSMYWIPANASVITESKVKALKISKKFIEDVLNWNVIIDARLVKQLDILLKKYIKWRENYNLLSNQYFQELINYWNKPLNEIIEVWNIFLEILLKSNKAYRKVQNELLTYKWKENNKLFFLKKWTVIRKNGTKFILENDELIWENTFLQYITGDANLKANATIEIINWEMVEMTFDEIKEKLKENNLGIEEIKGILEKITQLRANNNDFVWFWWKNVFSWTSPFKKAA